MRWVPKRGTFPVFIDNERLNNLIFTLPNTHIEMDRKKPCVPSDHCPYCGNKEHAWYIQRFDKLHNPQCIFPVCTKCGHLFLGLTVNKVDYNKGRDYGIIQWSKMVRQRDQKCVICGSTEKLIAHHIKEYALYPEERYNVENGMTLCNLCHRIIHQYETHHPNLKMVKEKYEQLIGGYTHESTELQQGKPQERGQL